MSTFELEIWDDETEKVTFYTVRWEGASQSETDKFFEAQSNIDASSTQTLLSLILDTIGTDHGAIGDFFNRFEDNVTALPPQGRVVVGEFTLRYSNFPLRLYALRIKDREDLVVLFNGGRKIAGTNMESGALNMKFIEAKEFAKKIDQALQDGSIVIDEEARMLKSYNGAEEIIL